MTIRSRRDVWLFVTVITIGTCFAACGLNFIVFPAEVLFMTLPGTIVITSCVTVPTCVFVGRQMLENQRLSDELQQLVDRDRLTDAATRDFFFSQMKQAPDAYGVSLMVDIDHFKLVNDTYGHLAGDEVIRHVADVLRRNVRKTDIVARFGGEEFVVFLDGHDTAVGFQTAERMRRDIAAETAGINGTSIGVTVSIGGSLKEAYLDVDASIREADDALYRAKAQGRNRTVFATPTGLELRAG